MTGRWHKRPEVLALRTEDNFRHPECYLRDLGSCSEKISREHLITEAVLRAINKTGIVASGLPWMKGEEHKIGLNTVIGKCLCTSHNSALAPLDNTAANFFRAIEECDLHREGQGKHFLFSGHDIERWLLKTLAGMAASRNLASAPTEPLLAGFHTLIDVPRMLQDVSIWLPKAGLYFTQRAGEQILRGDHFWLAPVYEVASNTIGGMTASIQGFQFVLLGAPFTASKGTVVERSTYRLEKIRFQHETLVNVIELSWNDGAPHPTFDTSFLMTDGERKERGLPPPPNAV